MMIWTTYSSLPVLDFQTSEVGAKVAPVNTYSKDEQLLMVNCCEEPTGDSPNP
jgi:hypothetical protein